MLCIKLLGPCCEEDMEKKVSSLEEQIHDLASDKAGKIILLNFAGIYQVLSSEERYKKLSTEMGRELDRRRAPWLQTSKFAAHIDTIL